MKTQIPSVEDKQDLENDIEAGRNDSKLTTSSDDVGLVAQQQQQQQPILRESIHATTTILMRKDIDYCRYHLRSLSAFRRNILFNDPYMENNLQSDQVFDHY